MRTVARVWLLLLVLHLVVVAVAWGAGEWAGFFTLAAVHLAWVAVTLWPGSTPFGKARRSFPLGPRELVLTIDDGPCADTPAVLDLLDQHQARAVFFVIGQRATVGADWVREIAQRGHLVENHTLTHPSATFWAAGPARLHREIAGCSEILTTLTGRRPRWFRAPAGFRNPFTAPLLKSSGLAYLGWTARGFDTRETDLPRLLARLRRGFRPGAVLLIHQGHPHSLALLTELLEALAADGWRTVLPPLLPE